MKKGPFEVQTIKLFLLFLFCRKRECKYLQLELEEIFGKPNCLILCQETVRGCFWPVTLIISSISWQMSCMELVKVTQQFHIQDTSPSPLNSFVLTKILITEGRCVLGHVGDGNLAVFMIMSTCVVSKTFVTEHLKIFPKKKTLQHVQGRQRTLLNFLAMYALCKNLLILQ